jgi:hypothetical protein
LQDHGADLSLRNKRGESPYDLIIEADNVDLFKIYYQDIMSNEKFRNTKQKSMFAPFFWANTSKQGTKCLEYMLQKSIGQEL